LNTLRTSLEVDADLLESAISFGGFMTKRKTIEVALAEFVERRKQKNLLDLKGKIQFSDGYDYKAMRADREFGDNK
jgi:Arc/MetJ family transcription regulator